MRRTLGVPACALILGCWADETIPVHKPAAAVVPDTSLTPVPMARGVITTDAIEHDIAFLPDERTVLFSRRSGRWGEHGQHSTIYISNAIDDGWSTPDAVPFSGVWSDADVFVAPDGSHAVFVSTRPTPLGSGRGRDIWLVGRTPTGWGEPRHLPPPISSLALDIGPSLAADGTLYFASDRAGGHGSGDLYRAPLVSGGYPSVENLGPVVNGPSAEWNVVVAPDESFIIFESASREGGLGPGGDLYLSYRLENGWGAPVHLDAISTPGSDLMPRISPDGSRLYFATTFTLDGTHADIVSVALPALLERYPRPAATR